MTGLGNIRASDLTSPCAISPLCTLPVSGNLQVRFASFILPPLYTLNILVSASIFPPNFIDT